MKLFYFQKKASKLEKENVDLQKRLSEEETTHQGIWLLSHRLHFMGSYYGFEDLHLYSLVEKRICGIALKIGTMGNSVEARCNFSQ